MPNPTHSCFPLAIHVIDTGTDHGDILIHQVRVRRRHVRPRGLGRIPGTRYAKQGGKRCCDLAVQMVGGLKACGKNGRVSFPYPHHPIIVSPFASNTCTQGTGVWSWIKMKRDKKEEGEDDGPGGLQAAAGSGAKGCVVDCHLSLCSIPDRGQRSFGSLALLPTPHNKYAAPAQPTGRRGQQGHGHGGKKPPSSSSS